MVKVFRTYRHSSASDLAGIGPGYVAWGEGEHSRRNTSQNFSGYSRRSMEQRGREHTLDELITKMENRIHWIECELRAETNK